MSDLRIDAWAIEGGRVGISLPRHLDELDRPDALKLVGALLRALKITTVHTLSQPAQVKP